MGETSVTPQERAKVRVFRSDCRCGVDHKALIRSRIKEDRDTGCWLWTAVLNRDGYGTTAHRSSRWLAHRLAYIAWVGPIPPDLTLDHLCRVRACVNPRHLEPVTNHVNILRGEGAAARNAAKTTCSNGHPLPPFEPGVPRICLECARISSAKRRKAGNLPPDDPRHGRNGYGNLGCRCAICCQANTDAHREYMRRRRAAKKLDGA